MSRVPIAELGGVCVLLIALWLSFANPGQKLTRIQAQAEAATMAGDPARALEIYAEGVALAEARPHLGAALLVGMATCERSVGRVAESLTRLDALPLARLAVEDQIWAQLEAGLSALELGRREEAHRRFLAAEELAVRIGDEGRQQELEDLLAATRPG